MNEVILNICSRLDTPSLLALSKSHGKFYQVCSEIIKERREIYKVEKAYQQEIDDLTDKIYKIINRGLEIVFEKTLPDGSIVTVSIYLTQESDIGITQFTDIGGSFNWIAPGIPHKPPHPGVPNIQYGIIKKKELDKLRFIAKNLIDQGYERID